MKRLYIYFLGLLAASVLFAQKRPKYEDELPKILALPSAGQSALLKVYQSEDPENASIDLQLALVYEKRYRESDVLTEYRYKYGNAREALTYFTKAKIRVDERDVKRNEEHYFNFGTVDDRGRVEVEYDTINQKINAVIPELRDFINHAPGIYNEFTQSFSHYDEAHMIYTQILGEYPTEKDLFLLFDESTNEKFDRIKEEYLEAVKHFKAYQDSIKNYPIGYDQELTIKELKVYKLDGLESEIQFLSPQVSMWDYATWVDNTRAYIDENIDKLRVDLAAENLRANQIIEKAQPDFIRETFEPLDINKEVLFTLRKYDLNSVIEPIFLYKEAKHDLIYQELLSGSLEEDTSVDVNRKLYLYGQMINKIRDADSILIDIEKRNTELTHEKYESFLQTYYQGQSGVESFVSQERTANQQDFGNYVSTLREMIFSQYDTSSTEIEYDYRRIAIPGKVSEPLPDESLTGDLLTTHRIENFDGSAFLGGIFKNEEEGKTSAFVVGITNDGKVGWYNTYLLQIDSAEYDANTRLAQMAVVPGGIMFILNGINPVTGDRVNHLVRLDETGNETLNKRMLFQDYPRSMFYNQTDNSVMISFKGQDFNKDIFQASELILSNYNLLGDLRWQQRIEYKGDLVDIISLLDSYMVIGNYNELPDRTGRIMRAGSANTDTKAFAMRVSLEGQVEKIESVSGSTTHFVNEVYKVSDDCINLLGTKGAYVPTVEVNKDPGTFAHIIINRDVVELSNSMQ